MKITREGRVERDWETRARLGMEICMSLASKRSRGLPVGEGNLRPEDAVEERRLGDGSSNPC